jgi:hypothetical protein
MADDNREHTVRRRTKNLKIDPAARARWSRTSRLRGYGLTQEAFDALLVAQGYACAMGGEPFTEASVICVDHDHACCPDSMKSCGKCVRGLLCSGCNRALGIVERKGEQAQRYLDAVRGTRLKMA